MSVILIRLLLFLAPIAVFLLWLWLMEKLRKGGDGALPERTSRMISYGGGLLAAGIVGLMLYLASRESPVDPRDLNYVPAAVDDGGKTPGHFEKKPDDGTP